ncbi:MAG: right-handed parallel beta-helix repeat-containing protein [Puniceicoccaceae bacterium]
MNLYFDPQRGSDANEGTLERPLKSLGCLPGKLRELRREYAYPRPVEVILRDGTYRLEESLLLDAPELGAVTLRAENEGGATISGGRVVSGWQEAVVGGRTVWKTTLPEVAERKWYFRELFVNGERRPRARWPKFDAASKRFATERIAEIHTRGKAVPEVALHAGDFEFRLQPDPDRKWPSIGEAEAVLLHFWIDERMPDLRLDGEGWLTSSHESCFNLREAFNEKLGRYYIDNLLDELTEPGEWYLNRKDGTLLYIPREGESMESCEFIAPVVRQLFVVHGKPHKGEFVEHVAIEGIRFEHADWSMCHSSKERHDQPWIVDKPYGSASQNTVHIKGTLSFMGSRHVRIDRCEITKTGFFAIAVEQGCEDVAISRCRMSDLGGGGVKVTGADAYAAEWTRTSGVTVRDCEIHGGGRVFHAAPGIVAAHASHNKFLHNHISDFFNTGIACGSVWSYEPTRTFENQIVGNHIHNLGQGLLNDMGGIYLLGVQPGTIVRNNWVHDITAEDYGAHGIYLDESCSHVVVENNVAHHVDGVCMILHKGRENVIRNNIFAFGKHAVVEQSNVDHNPGFTFMRNLVLSDGASPVVMGGYACDIFKTRSVLEGNLYWGGSPGNVVFGNVRFDENPHYEGTGLAEWSGLGYDTLSLESDPLLEALGTADLTVAENSPAHRIGFKPFSLQNTGPRTDEEADSSEAFVSTTEMKFG